MKIYRLLREKFAGSNPFNGEGSFLFGSRWSSVGNRVSYGSTHRSLAILEYRAHIDPAFMPQDLVIVSLILPDDLLIAPTPPLPKNWRSFPPPALLSAIGDQFVANRKSAAMLLPSVLVPEENNLLINPRHPDFKRMRLSSRVIPYNYDRRLL